MAAFVGGEFQVTKAPSPLNASACSPVGVAGLVRSAYFYVKYVAIPWRSVSLKTRL